MRLKVRFSAIFAIAAIVAVCVFASVSRAQSPVGSSSSSQNSTQTAPAQPATNPATGNGTYISTDPLAGVRYDNRYDLSLGMAYDHMKAGPTLLQGSNLGGLDLEGSYWLTKHWGVQASGRGYIGTSGTAPNAPNNIRGPVVKQ